MDHHPYRRKFYDSELSAPGDELSRLTRLGQGSCSVLNGSSMVGSGSGFLQKQVQGQSPASSFNIRFNPFEVGNHKPVLSSPTQQPNLGFGSLDSGSVVPYQDCSPRVLLNNLFFLEQKIHDLQGVVKSMVQESCQTDRTDGFSIRQQMVVADTASIIIQLISTAARLPLAGQQSLLGDMDSSMNPVIAYLSSLLGAVSGLALSNWQQIGREHQISGAGIAKGDALDFDNQMKARNASVDHSPLVRLDEVAPVKYSNQVEQLVEHDSMVDLGMKDEEDDGEEENLPPSSYEVLELGKEEILAPHAHLCSICGKGFKRDANLRMHMRGHGDKYKTPEALSKPHKEENPAQVSLKRYSCPFEGCKRNRKHNKFQPLKTILCVKNHYKRSHCDKSYICSRCNRKKFSVLADLKTHEKHCGQDKWLCSCGTTFSRKDKLFGHVALFPGHTPMIPASEVKWHGVIDQHMKAGRKKISYASSPNPASRAESESGLFAKNQTAVSNVAFAREENKQNSHTDIFSAMGQVPQLLPSLVGGSFPLHALLSGNFIQPNRRNPDSDAL